MFIRFILSHSKDDSSSCLGSYVYTYEGETINWAVDQIMSLTIFDKEIASILVNTSLDRTDRNHPMFTRRIMHNLILTVVRVF
jgi:hypothetical protein